VIGSMKDRIVVVTGGASGIGLASVRLFAAEGASVAIWDCSPDAANVSQQINDDMNCLTASFHVDVSDEKAVRIALQQTQQRFGTRVDHLVHGVAIGSGKFGFPFLNLEPSDWVRVLQVNIMGMVNVAHAIAPSMIEQKSGSMVFLASVAGQIGSQTDPPYSASKAANINFAQCIAKDLAPHGIRVNTICPGMVKTPLNRSVWQAWFDQAGMAERMTYEEWSQKKIESIVPLKQWQTPEDIANMVFFLSSERGAQVTGQTINVDGGYVMHW